MSPNAKDWKSLAETEKCPQALNQALRGLFSFSSEFIRRL